MLPPLNILSASVHSKAGQASAPLGFIPNHLHSISRLQSTSCQCSTARPSASTQFMPNHFSSRLQHNPLHGSTGQNSPRLQTTSCHSQSSQASASVPITTYLGYLISCSFTRSYLPQSWLRSWPMPCSAPYSNIASRISRSITSSSSTLRLNFSVGLST